MFINLNQYNLIIIDFNLSKYPFKIENLFQIRIEQISIVTKDVTIVLGGGTFGLFKIEKVHSTW